MNQVARNRKSFTALLIAAALATLVVFLPAAQDSAAPAANPAFPEIILEVNDTSVSPYDTVYYMSVYLTNTLSEVAGFVLQLSADQAAIVGVVDTERVDTIVNCDTLGVCDTTIDTIAVSSVDMTGSDIADWEYLAPRALTPQTFRFTALADLVGGTTVAPLPVATSTPHLLFRMVLQRLASLDVLDTLQDRTVDWTVSYADFSDVNGQLIGLQESTFCVNPPTCDTIDTTRYYDPTINVYIGGTLTLGPTCVLGDTNLSGAISAADIIVLVNYVFRGGPTPPCDGVSGDVDCSGTINSADIIALVNYVYRGGALPCS